jgi:hypothetical protein
VNAAAILRAVYGFVDERNLNPQGYYYYLNYRVKKFLSDDGYVDRPFETIRIDPAEIDVRQNETIDKWKHLGEVRGGNWDELAEPIEASAVYVSLIQRFENGASWEETPVYRRARERIRRGGSSWNGCRTVEELDERTRAVDELFREIRTRGYEPQSEVFGEPPEQLLLNRRFNRSKTDVAVSIGRNGEPILTDGHHRLAIAQVLELESIPIRVVVRHRRWENVRRSIRNAMTRSELTETALSHLDHPDVDSEHLRDASFVDDERR